MALLTLFRSSLIRGSRNYIRPVRYTTELVAHNRTEGGIPVYRVLNENGELLDRKTEPKFSRENARKMIKDMIVLASLDQILYEAQRQGRISFYMTNTGEEASHIGSVAALQPDDPIFGQYRELGTLIWRGFTITDVVNQCYSNHLDIGKGRQMPVHYGSPKYHFQTISSPLGTQIPQAAGAAYSLKMQGQKKVVMCYFGEGAASEGDFHAGLNLAATTESPVIYFCRNNHYAISTSLDEQYRGDGIASRGPGYGIPAFRVDGNDLLAVYNVTHHARKLALERNTPVIIEAITYRVGHHSTSDDSLAYRGKEEIEQWTSGNNPTTRFQKYLIQKQWWSLEEEGKLRDETRKEVLIEFNAAEGRLKPAIQEMFTDVYDKLPWNLKEQREELRQILKEHPDKYPIDQHVESAAFLKIMDFKDVLQAEIQAKRKMLEERVGSKKYIRRGEMEREETNQQAPYEEKGVEGSDDEKMTVTVAKERDMTVLKESTLKDDGGTLRGDASTLKEDADVLGDDADTKVLISPSKRIDEALLVSAMETESIQCEDLKDDPAKVRTLVSLFLKRLLREQGEQLSKRSEEERNTREGKLATTAFFQGQEHLRPLFKLLRKGGIPVDVLNSLAEICGFMQKREYVRANNVYLKLAIGNAPWPIGVTAVGIHERSSQEKIKSNQVARNSFISFSIFE